MPLARRFLRALTGFSEAAGRPAARRNSSDRARAADRVGAVQGFDAATAMMRPVSPLCGCDTLLQLLDAEPLPRRRREGRRERLRRGVFAVRFHGRTPPKGL